MTHPAGAPQDTSERPARPPISVTISTVQGWPDVRGPITEAAESVRRVGGELIVTDGSDQPAPTPAELGDGVRWLAFPGQSVFQLRERAYKVATGELVAVTEDHVHVPGDWAERMDWGSFLIVQAPVAAPIRSGPARRLSGAVNVAYKRDALARIDDFGGLGAMDGLHQKALAASGATLLNDDTIRVQHDQSPGFRGSTAIHDNAGRTISGFKRRHLGAVDLLRILGAPVVPMARYLPTVWLLAPRGYGPQLMRCTPAILWLLYGQGVGQLLGCLLGPGDSPRRVQ
jgi:hypothetical protein